MGRSSKPRSDRPSTRHPEWKYRLILLLTPVLLAATPARPPSTGAIRVTAGGLARAYEENGVLADLNFRGKELKLVGVVANAHRDELRRVVVEFELGGTQRTVACVFPESEAAAVGQLRKGRLITVSALGGDPVERQPRLTNGSISWLEGDADSPRPALLAASVDLCLAKGLFSGQDALLSDEGPAPDIKAVPRELAARSRRAGQRAAALLAKRKEAPLPCLHPLVSAVVWCDRGGGGAPECRSRLIRSAQGLLARD